MIFFCLVPSTLCLLAPARAQINPDNTLGVESSRVTPNTFINGLPADQIDGGAQRGSNLFHSFTQFNVNDGQRVFFANPLDVKNIFTRITGGQASNILGTLGVDGNANLFLMNPNGILFGENASLNVNGSFVATTANRIQFGNLNSFSATNPEAPSSLLTINPSALFFNQINATASIQNNSIADAGKDPTGIDVLGLRVLDGKSLLLVGGNVSMDGGKLNAYGGRVELGGLAIPGNVNVFFDRDNLRLGFPENVNRADVLLTNQAAINVEGAGGGNIAINARNLEILKESSLFAGIARGLGTPETVAGDITLNTTGEIKVAGRSSIANDVLSGAKGSGGNITIDSGSLSLPDNALLAASTFGLGNAGNVTVRAVDAVSLAGNNTAIFSTLEAGGVGKGGNIDINAATLSLTDGAQLLTLTRGASNTQPAGRGNAGNVNVKVTGNVDITGNKNGFVSGISSLVDTGTVGKGGNITIDSGSFSLRDGAALAASTSGQGNAGNVTVRAVDAVSLVEGDIISTLEAGGVGQGGNIDINAASLSLTDSAQLLTSTRGASNSQPAGRGDAGNVNIKVTGNVDIVGTKNASASGIGSSVDTGTLGNGGNITIDSGSLSLRDGAALLTSTYGQGNAGNVTVRAVDAVSLADSSILSTVEAEGVGNGGNIDINAASLSLTDGAQLATITRGASNSQPAGRGDAGNVNVKVTGNVDIAGQKNGFASGIASFLDTGTVGNGGNITIDSGSFSLRDDAQLEASTRGQGNAGNVTVQAKSAASLVNAVIFSTVEAGGVGNGGKIDINAASLSLQDGAQLATSTRGASNTQPAGRGNGGNVNVKVTGNADIAGNKNGFVSGIFSSVATGTVGNGGNITIDSGSFSLRDGALLSASTSGQGNAGNVTVRANIFEVLNGGQLITTTSSNGSAGKIIVNATEKVIISSSDSNYNNRLTQFPDRVVNVSANSGFFVSSSGSGITGDIEINSPKITLDNQGQLNANSASGNGGNINLNSDLLLLRRGSKISTNAGTDEKGGDGGNIDINSIFIVAVPKENSDIAANAFNGTGGDVKIRTQSIFGIEARPKESSITNDITASSENGVQGEISINQPDTDPARGLVQLPSNLVDASQQIASGCTPGGRQTASRFIATGRGGLPLSPNEPLRGRAVITDWVNLPEQTIDNLSREITDKQPTEPAKKSTTQIVEAQGWVVDANGEVLLVAKSALRGCLKSFEESNFMPIASP